MERFFNKKVDYFWEYEYPFAEYFLKEIFPVNTFKRKCLLKDSGIVNLVYWNNKIYEIKFTQAKSIVENDNSITTDKDKNEIVNIIRYNLPVEYTINKGKFITFKLGNYIAKIEIIKKMREPE